MAGCDNKISPRNVDPLLQDVTSNIFNGFVAENWKLFNWLISLFTLLMISLAAKVLFNNVMSSFLHIENLKIFHVYYAEKKLPI